MYVIEVWEKRKYKELESTKRPGKAELEAEVEELNKLVPREVLRFMPVSKKYRVKKIKNNKQEEVV
jgi:hypothetical protein